MNRFTPQLAVVLAVAALSLTVIPFVIQRRFARSEIAQRRERVASMTDDEHARLEINYERFQHLQHENPTQLERIRDTHRAMRQRPQLVATATRYHDWLKTLDSWQQAEIRAIDDSQQRFTYVSRLLDHSVVRFAPRWERLRRAFPDGIEVPREDAEKMAEALKAGLARLSDRDGNRRPGGTQRGEPDRMRREMFEPLFANAVAEISDPELKKQLQQPPEPWMTAVMVCGLLRELENRRSGRNPEQVQQAFSQLPPAEQDEIMQRTPDVARGELRSLVRSDEPGDREYHRLIHSINLMADWGRRGPGLFESFRDRFRLRRDGRRRRGGPEGRDRDRRPPPPPFNGPRPE